MKKDKKIEKKAPPTKAMKSIQYDIFSQFITNDEKSVSNTVELWECIPKYFFTPAQVEKLRTPTGHADPYKWDYVYNDIHFSVKIQPALIEQEDGSYKAFFPGTTEELVEEVLKKILTDQRCGFHDPDNQETWIRFSLRMIGRELKLMGRERNISQIKQAIEVMSSCILTLYKEGKEIWKGPILQDLVTVGREEYLADTDSHHMARLPLFISHSINKLEYRQFNYSRLMDCNEQLTRWIYKQLINRYRQANFLNDYHFMYSTIAKNSGLLQQITDRKNRQKLISALMELQEKKVISSYKEEFKMEDKKISDVKYTVAATSEFISEQKAANKRFQDSMQTLILKNELPPDSPKLLSQPLKKET